GYALAMFSVGMFAWGAQYIFSRGFYATHNTWTPAIVGTLVTVLNLPVYWWFVHKYQYLGLALSSSIGVAIYMIVLFVLLNRHTHNREAGGVIVFFLKISFASAVAGLVCFRLTTWFQARVAWHNRPGALMILILVTAVGVLVTIAMAKILGISELNMYLRKLAMK